MGVCFFLKVSISSSQNITYNKDCEFDKKPGDSLEPEDQLEPKNSEDLLEPKNPEDLLEPDDLLEPKNSSEPENLLEPENSTEPKDPLFQLGHAYSSLEAFKYVADQYAITNGFKVILYKSNNRSDGVHYTQVFACDRYAVFNHNHPLIPVRLMRVLNREIPADIKEEILLVKKVGISTSQIQSLLVV
ncbi:4790_t:CDS:2, partial [Diversispora eburnea]